MSTLSKEAILVRSALEARGLETPRIETSLTNAEKKARIEAHMRDVMEVLGLDMSDDSLAETPQRIAKMYVEEISLNMYLKIINKDGGKTNENL